MKKKVFTDPRITAKKTSVKQYILIVALLIVISASNLVICLLMNERGENIWIIIGASVTFIAVVSAGLIFFIAYLRSYFLSAPINKICDAARKLATGDFSVRIEPNRKDGLKDEFEVLYDDLNTMAAELQSVKMLKTDFISNVSHELKTPLSVIQNYATMLQSDGLTEDERKDYSLRISEATKRLSVLVTDILQLSRLENQNISANKNTYNLSEQLCRSILTFEHILDEKGIELDTDFDDTVTLDSDERLLDIVWNNLLSNALKFTDDGGTVKISAKRENAYVIVSVADSGCGMTEQQMMHIFDKFYQADTSHATMGNGLGLALVKKILGLLDGEIKVRSKEGEGSEFAVKLKLN